MRFDDNRKMRHFKAFSEWWRLRSSNNFNAVDEDEYGADQEQIPSTSTSTSPCGPSVGCESGNIIPTTPYSSQSDESADSDKNFRNSFKRKADPDITLFDSKRPLHPHKFTYFRFLRQMTPLREEILRDYSKSNGCQQYSTSKVVPLGTVSAGHFRYCNNNADNAELNSNKYYKTNKMAHRRLPFVDRKRCYPECSKNRNIASGYKHNLRHNNYARTILVMIFCVATVLFGQAVAQLQTSTSSIPTRHNTSANSNSSIPIVMSNGSSLNGTDPLVHASFKSNGDFAKTTTKFAPTKSLPESTTITPKLEVTRVKNPKLIKLNTKPLIGETTTSPKHLSTSGTSSTFNSPSTVAKIELQNPTKSPVLNTVVHSSQSISVDQHNRTLANGSASMKTLSKMVVNPDTKNKFLSNPAEKPRTSTTAPPTNKKVHFFSAIRVPLWSKDSAQNFFFKDAHSSIYLVKISEDSWNSYEKFKEETCRENEEEPIGGKVLNNTDSGYFSWEENVFHQELRKIILPETSHNRLTPLIGSPFLKNLDARFFMSAPKSLCRAQKFAMDEEELKKLERQHFEDYLINKVFDRDIWMRGRGGGKSRKKSVSRNGGDDSGDGVKQDEKADVNYRSINVDLRRKLLIVP